MPQHQESWNAPVSPRPPALFLLCSRRHFGGDDQKKVTCIDCHDPHGNGRARNLQWASDPAATPGLGLFTNPGAAGLSRYEASTVPGHWNAGLGSGFGPTPRVRPMVNGATDYMAGRQIDAQQNGAFCLTCHRARGSDVAFGLVFPLPCGAAAPGCDQCHRVADVVP